MLNLILICTVLILMGYLVNELIYTDKLNKKEIIGICVKIIGLLLLFVVAVMFVVIDKTLLEKSVQFFVSLIIIFTFYREDFINEFGNT